jgi:hypothetical protein
MDDPLQLYEDRNFETNGVASGIFVLSEFKPAVVSHFMTETDDV